MIHRIRIMTAEAHHQTVELPSNAKVMHVALNRNGNLCLWYESRYAMPPHDFNLYWLEDGMHIPDNARYLKSVFYAAKTYHLYTDIPSA